VAHARDCAGGSVAAATGALQLRIVKQRAAAVEERRHEQLQQRQKLAQVVLERRPREHQPVRHRAAQHVAQPAGALSRAVLHQVRLIKHRIPKAKRFLHASKSVKRRMILRQCVNVGCLPAICGHPAGLRCLSRTWCSSRG
jgi:hypothetical protein